MKKNKHSSIFLLLLVACLVLPQTVLAHGGGQLQISNASVGNYQVSVWSNPPTALAGQEIHVTVGIARTETGEPVLDAAVAVTLIKESGEVIATAEATTDQSANRLFYETDLDGVAIGLYEVQIEVTGREGSGTLLFPLAVEAAPLWPWLVGTAAVGGILVLVLRYWRKGVKTAVSRRQTAVSRTRSVD